MSSQYSVRKNVKSYKRIYVILFVRDRQMFVDINNIKRINRVDTSECGDGTYN